MPCSASLPVYPHALPPHPSSWAKGPGPQEICIITGAILAKIWKYSPVERASKRQLFSPRNSSSNSFFPSILGPALPYKNFRIFRRKLFCFHQKAYSFKKPCWEKTASLDTVRSTVNSDVVVSKPPQALPKYLHFSMHQPPTPAFLYSFLYVGIGELRIQLQQEVLFSLQ